MSLPGNKKNLIGLALIFCAFILGWWLGCSSDSDKIRHDHDTTMEVTEGSIWTCSMHPQIRQSNPGKCPICAMDLIPVSGSESEEVSFREIKLSARALKLAEIQTIPVKRKAVSEELKLIGKVTFDETRVAHIAARVDGRIDRLYADYTGIIVKTGDNLVDLYSPELISTQQELLETQNLLRLNSDSTSLLYQTALKNRRAVRQRLRLWGFSDHQIEAIQQARQPFDHLTIQAPISGTVIHKNVVEGSYVMTGMNIFTIADLSQVWILLEAYETDLPFLRLDQRVFFSSAALPGERFSGTVSFIDPVLDDRSRTIAVRVQAINHKHLLKPDMFIDAVVQTNPQTKGIEPLVIPASAVLQTGKRALVYVADPVHSGIFAGREVKLGGRAGDFYIIRDGLQEGEEVVVNGAFKIDSELQIMAKPSLMNLHELADTQEAQTKKFSNLPDLFLDQLAGVVNAYFEIHQDLSHDNLDKAKIAAKILQNRVDLVQLELLKGEAQRVWMEDHKMIRFYADKIKEAAEIGSARINFEGLSNTLIQTARQLGTSGKQKIWVFHCPMAFNNKGANWLQNTEETENPYFGSSMFKCGSKIEDLTKK